MVALWDCPTAELTAGTTVVVKAVQLAGSWAEQLVDNWAQSKAAPKAASWVVS